MQGEGQGRKPGSQRTDGKLRCAQNLEDLPQPHKAGLIKLKEQPEGFYAICRFSGEILLCPCNFSTVILSLSPKR